MITIDSQIWIYYFDPNAPENSNIKKWIEPVLSKEKILLSTVIPLEVSHNLYAVPKVNKNDIENLILKWISQEYIEFVEADQQTMLIALEILKNNRSKGIGGKNCLILASMLNSGVETIVTHDKNLLRIQNLRRIDPVIDPPLILNKGEEFDESKFTQY